MRIPVPTNKLVAFTLAGALLTAIVAGTLALAGGDLAQAGDHADSTGTTASDASQQVAVDAPTPNRNFTPAVGARSGYEGEEHEAEYEDREEEDEGEDEEHDGEDEEHEEEE